MFSIHDLKPKKVPFDLGDGNEIYFVTMKEFTLAQKVTWDNINNGLTRYARQKEKAYSIVDKTTKEARLFEVQKKYLNLFYELVKLCLPDYPQEVIDSYDYGTMDQLAAMCLSVTKGMFANVDEPPDESDIELIGNMYPDFSKDFMDTLNVAQVALLLENETEKNVADQLQTS